MQKVKSLKNVNLNQVRKLNKQTSELNINKDNNKQFKKESNMKQRVMKILNNDYITTLFMIITFWALFADDIRVLTVSKDYDKVFYGITSAVFGIFLIELILQSYGKKDYFLSFFFYLDLISTASLLFDIGWIMDGISNSGADIFSIAKAGRASRVGTRTTRIVRIVRLVRLVKLYKHTKKMMEEKAAKIKAMKENYENVPKDSSKQLQINKKKEQLNANLEEQQFFNQQQQVVQNKQDSSQNIQIVNKNVNQSNLNLQSNEVNESDIHNHNNKSNPDNIMQETNVGKKLSDLTVQRLICIVISIIFTVPIFNLDTYITEYTAPTSGLQFMNKYISNMNDAKFVMAKDSYIQFLTGNDIRSPLIQLKYKNDNYLYVNSQYDINQLRESDIQSVIDQDLMALLNNEKNNQLNAVFGIIRTIFVCFVLVISSVYFSKDTNELVVRPIEIMLEKVKKISNNPLEAAQIEEQEAFLKDQIKNDQLGSKNLSNSNSKQNKKNKEQSTYETSILEKTIIKIGGLLALGFGEAGSGIIAANMAAGGEVNPMLPGKKTMAIFGFCDIRNFTDATEILQEDVMLFVNEIADITHGIVDQFGGAANKNIGDAFLLVWKYNNKMVTRDQNGNPKLLNTKQSQQFSDLALLAFLKIMAAISLSKKLKKYRNHPKLNERMPNYQVKMGFGLHCGFGIEGSIGSVYKIDASYLSPNVNMASRLEAATKQFGVPILLSGSLIQAMSPECSQECRIIDRITVKGSVQPIDIYTCDADIINLEQKIKVGQIDKMRQDNMNRNQMKIMKFKARMKREIFLKDLKQNKINLHQQFFINDEEIYSMRQTFSQEFFQTFSEGFKQYIDGNWQNAKEILQQVHNLHPNCSDGPTNSILSTIEENGGKAPESWQGYRNLTEK